MTEQEWLESADPGPMLEFLRGKASGRKSKLFSVACCRRLICSFDTNTHYDSEIREVINNIRCAIDVCERHFDGFASAAEFSVARDQTIRYAAIWSYAAMHAADASTIACQRYQCALQSCANDDHAETARYAAVTAAYDALVQNPDTILTALANAYNSGEMDISHDWEAGEATIEASPTYRVAYDAEQVLQVGLLRCIFGNPFRPVTVNPSRLAPAVGNLAQEIYENRAFDRLPALADALEEAGCNNAEILGHCRGPGPHGKGCWVVDAMLGKD